MVQACECQAAPTALERPLHRTFLDFCTDNQQQAPTLHRTQNTNLGSVTNPATRRPMVKMSEVVAHPTMSAAAQSMTPRCYLLKIPAELRLQIYEHLFADIILTVGLGAGSNAVYAGGFVTTRHPQRPKDEKLTGALNSLARTCKVLEEEAISAFYDTLTVRILLPNAFQLLGPPKLVCHSIAAWPLLARVKAVTVVIHGDISFGWVWKGASSFVEALNSSPRLQYVELYFGSTGGSEHAFHILCPKFEGLQCKGRIHMVLQAAVQKHCSPMMEQLRERIVSRRRNVGGAERLFCANFKQGAKLTVLSKTG
jgi:hypothetical protein